MAEREVTGSQRPLLQARFDSVPAVREGLAGVSYLADEGIAGVVFLADRLGKPVLVEGPAGVGKTELAKSVAAMTGSRLIRLQCYEGLDESKALYEWNYKKQLLRIQAQRVVESGDGAAADAAGAGGSWSDLEEDRSPSPSSGPWPLRSCLWSSSPRTTPASCRRRSSGVVCTSTSTTPSSSGRRRSS
jgi:hypothetical protein